MDDGYCRRWGAAIAVDYDDDGACQLIIDRAVGANSKRKSLSGEGK